MALPAENGRISDLVVNGQNLSHDYGSHGQKKGKRSICPGEDLRVEPEIIVRK
jgi:hypothetical protein